MTRRLIFTLAILLTAAMRQQVFGQAIETNSIIDFQLQEPIKNHEGWLIGVNQSGTRCYATAVFENQTTVWLGIGDDSNDFLIAFSNRSWSSIEAGNVYDLEVAYNRQPWRGSFAGFIYGDAMGLVARGLSKEFVMDFGRSLGFEIRYQGKSIGRLSLAGSKGALAAAISCAQDFVRPGDPFARPNTQSDPFAARQPAAGDISLVGSPEVKLGFGPDMPKFGSEWRLGVEEAGVVEAELTSADLSLVLHLSPSRKENFFPVTCKYSITVYGTKDKPAPGTVASWSADRVAATDQKGMVELSFAGGPIRTFTEPSDYYGGRTFEYDFNSDQVAATSIEVSVPSSPEIKPVRFNFQGFLEVLNYICASTQTVRTDGQNVLSPDATSRSGPRLGRCHMDDCSWSVLRSKTLLWADRRGALLKIEVNGGASQHKNDNGYPAEFTNTVKVEWDSRLYEYYVFCSKSLPTVIWPTDQGKYSVDYIDFTAIPGMMESSARLYSEDCHRVGLYRDLLPEAMVEQFGYRAVGEPSQLELTTPYQIFEMVK